MKITSIETFSTPKICITRIKSDTGAEGYGQIAPYYANVSAKVLHMQIAHYALGADALDIDSLVDRCIEGEYKFPGSHTCRAVGGIDTALWDLKGKVENKSVCELLGGKPQGIKAYGSSMSRSIQPMEEGKRLARLRDEHGFEAFKVRVGSVCGHDKDQWPGRTEELLPAVRRAVGDKVALYADGNSCYTPKKAIQVGRLLEDNGYCHFEEPCPYWELEWTKEAADALDVPVAGGEQDVSLAQFRRMMHMGAVDIVQPDICYVGGLSRALRVAKMAEEIGMTCTPHAANLSMVTVFTLHMLGAIPNGGLLEFSIEKTPSWADDIYYPALKAIDGKVGIPNGPGWGVVINPDWLKKAEYQISTLD